MRGAARRVEGRETLSRARSLAGRRDVLDLFTKSAGDLLDRWFESAPIKAAFGFDAVVGNFASPYTPGSAYVLLHHVFGEVNGKRGQWGHALRRHGRDHAGDGAGMRGARRRHPHGGAGRARRSSKAGRAAGVELDGGDVIDARSAWSPTSIRSSCSSASSRPSTSTPIFARASTAIAADPGTFRMNVALSALPDFTALPRHGVPRRITAAASSSRRRSPTWSARTSTRKTDGWSRAPIVEMLIPSVVDDSLAPPGMHVASLFCQHVHPELPRRAAGRTLGRCARRGRRPDDRHRRRDSRPISAASVARPPRAVAARPRARVRPRSAATSSTARWRSTSSFPRARCSATPTTGCRCADSTCAAPARTRAVASPAFPGRNAAREILRDVRRGRH